MPVPDFRDARKPIEVVISEVRDARSSMQYMFTENKKKQVPIPEELDSPPEVSNVLIQ
jgi:hypothetical protein